MRRRCFLLFGTISLLLMGCNATPNSTSEINGANVAKRESETGQLKYGDIKAEIPEHISEEYYSNDESIAIDAEIFFPVNQNEIYTGIVDESKGMDREKVKEILFDEKEMLEMSPEEAKNYGDFVWYYEDKEYIKMLSGDAHTLLYFTDSAQESKLSNSVTVIPINAEDESIRIDLVGQVNNMMEKLNLKQEVDERVLYKTSEGIYFYQFDLVAQIEGVKILSVSAKNTEGQTIISEKGLNSLTVVNNYTVKSKKEILLLPIEKILDIFQILFEKGTISAIKSKQPITKIELKYMLEESQEGIKFFPVWSFQTPYFFEDQKNDELGTNTEVYLGLNAENGEIVYYGIGG